MSKEQLKAKISALNKSFDAWDIVNELKMAGQQVYMIQSGGYENTEIVWRCIINDNIFVEAPTSFDAVTEAVSQFNRLQKGFALALAPTLDSNTQRSGGRILGF